MAGQGSARVLLNEIDLSQVQNQQQLPQGVPAAVVGPARKGPAFVPQTFANMQQFNETFGNMLERKKESNSNLLGPLALNEWMKSSQAGTYMRVLGVGDGKKTNSEGTVTDAGFVVGQKLVQSSTNPGSVANNQHATFGDDSSPVAIAKPHLLGCFMRDVNGSKFLEEAGVQSVSSTASTKVGIIKVNSPAAGSSFTIFLPKQVAVTTEDLTLTVKTVDAFSATVAKNTIEILDNGASDEQLADKIKAALIDATEGASTQATHKYSDITIAPGAIFAVADHASDTSRLNITLDVARKEGDDVVFTDDASNKLLSDPVVVLEGNSASVPVVRGFLMVPQGIKPALNPSSALAGTYVLVSEDTNQAEIRGAADNKIDAGFGNTPANNWIGYSIGDVSKDLQSFSLILNGFSNTKEPAVITCSFDPDSDNYFAKILNTDPTLIEEKGHYLYAHWDIDKEVAIPSNIGLLSGTAAIQNTDKKRMIGFCMPGDTTAPDYEDFQERYQTAHTPWFVSQQFGEEKYNLFKLHALDDGAVGSSNYRVLISNVRYVGLNEFGSFDLTLEDFSSDGVNGSRVISWKNLSLDINSRNFIGRIIGDEHTYWDFERDVAKQRLVSEGLFPVKNKYVRVELSQDLLDGTAPVEALPVGFHGLGYLNVKGSGFFNEDTSIDIFGDESTLFDNFNISPLPMVRSINVKASSISIEAEDDLAWGIKFGKKEHNDEAHKENVEQTFDQSLLSWAKFFPTDSSSKPVFVKSGNSASTFQNSNFSLENIALKNVTSDVIVNWDEAFYARNRPSASALPTGYDRYVNIAKDATGANVKYMKFRCMFQGGFDGVNIFDKEKSSFSGLASLREGLDEGSAGKFTGPTIMAYQKAVDVLKDRSAADFQLLVLPGQRSSVVTDYAVAAAEERFDALVLLDIEQKDAEDGYVVSTAKRPHVRNTVSRLSARQLDSSFGAAYFPDVLIKRPSDGAPMVVPPTVSMLGVMSRSDSLSDPWFAPAGLRRGLLSADDVEVNMNRALLDELYDSDVNPIYVPAGRSEVVAFGQKTLLRDASALDRINVRRLLINLRRKVKVIGEQLLFEPNKESTLVKFSSLVEPIMSEVQRRGGVERYKVQIDTSTTTQNDIENNTIRGKIYLQPTKSVEFISLDFVVANNIG